jgi:hypothetical protein
MINFDYLEENKEALRLTFLLAKPFSHIVVDHFCDEEKLQRLYADLPEIQTKSRDYVFAANKFEKSAIRDISPFFTELYDDLTSERFQHILSFVSNESVFVDKDFHGGGIHQGKGNSFLDMHLDFNYHPRHPMWYRYLNLLLYLNWDWKPEYGGHLKLRDLRTGEQTAVAVPFNRMIIQLTGRHTLHGYDLTHFPEGKYRTSIAAYAYCVHQYHIEKPRTTDWHPEDGNPVKKVLARIYDPAVKIKNKFFGSATTKNQ